MHRKTWIFYPLLILLFSALLLAGCSGGASPAEADGADSDSSKTSKSSVFSFGSSKSENHSDDEQRTTVTEYLLPVASGAVVYGNDIISIDASNVSEGYVMVRHMGGVDKVKLQITTPDGTTYSYTLAIGSFEAFPLSGGDGSYHLDVLEHAYDDMYAVAFSQDISVALSDEFRPYLYPNQYVWFTQDYKAVAYAASISEKSSNDLDYVEQVYEYVINNITYDEELAANVEADYLPNIDRTMETGKGICFDYASLMAAMLRSQGVPTKLVVGYSGDAYHAWISVYLTEIGWVDNIIEFDGKSWSLMDPTLAANNSSKSVAKYVGDGSNYTVKYSY